jgi:ABC-type phosphate/phosphonate transport system permease subunit
VIRSQWTVNNELTNQAQVKPGRPEWKKYVWMIWLLGALLFVWAGFDLAELHSRQAFGPCFLAMFMGFTWATIFTVWWLPKYRPYRPDSDEFINPGLGWSFVQIAAFLGPAFMLGNAFADMVSTADNNLSSLFWRWIAGAEVLGMGTVILCLKNKSQPPEPVPQLSALPPTDH